VTETELHTIVTKGRKETPDGTVIELGLGSAPGTVKVNLKLPGQVNFVSLDDLSIVDGTVTLPVNLVFLSHVKEDADKVAELSERFLQDGILAWFDENELLPGDDWENEIAKAMESSDYIAIFLSNLSCKKEGYFQKELKDALERNQLMPEGKRFIIPILLDECTPPKSLRKFHWVKKGGKDWYEKLVKAINESS
jgi:hypothetical protein